MKRICYLIALTSLTITSASAQQSAATQRLLERNEMFEPAIIEVAENVYTAIGYQVSANTMIVGDDGVIIIDPGQRVAGAEEVRAEFERITDKPVRAIVYTHGHGDHTNGSPAFYDPDAGIEVWARSNYGSETNRVAAAGLEGGARPSNTQGFDLLPEQKISVGIAIPPERLPAGANMTDGVAQPRTPAPRGIAPTHAFSEDRVTLEIAGVTLELVAAPGETVDQLYVWLPEQRVVFAGDNFYQSWPNVYPLRGTARRSIRDWISSIDSMIQEDPLGAAQLVQHVIRLRPDDPEPKLLMADALDIIGERTFNAPARNYTLSSANRYRQQASGND